MGANAGLSRPMAPSPARMADPAGLAGREDEMSRLLGVLGGDARLVLVVGDAGIGKTRFVAEAITRAETAGLVMLRGDCLPLSGTLPLLPLADALGELAGRDGGGLLAAALDATAGYVRHEVDACCRDLSASYGRRYGARRRPTRRASRRVRARPGGRATLPGR
jgi:hypothetical protein